MTGYVHFRLDPEEHRAQILQNVRKSIFDTVITFNVLALLTYFIQVLIFILVSVNLMFKYKGSYGKIRTSGANVAKL